MKLFTRTPKTIEAFVAIDGTRWAARADGTHTRNGSPITFAEYLTAAKAHTDFYGLPLIQH